MFDIIFVFLKSKKSNTNKTDLAVLYATAPGNLAIRNTLRGSYFINIFCEELRIKAKRTIFQESFYAS